MLSCRFSGPGTVPYRRRLASADAILLIASEQGVDALPPLPLIPYAVSLSTTMIYRALRDGQRQVECVWQDLMRCCEVFSTLTSIWTCVEGMQKLARRLLRLLTNPPAAAVPNTSSSTDSGLYNGSYEASSQYQNNISHLQHGCHGATSAKVCQCNGPCQCALYDMIPQCSIQDLDGTCFPFDMNFHDIFDGGVPNVFRGHESWELLNVLDTAFPTATNHELAFVEEDPLYSSPSK